MAKKHVFVTMKNEITGDPKQEFKVEVVRSATVYSVMTELQKVKKLSIEFQQVAPNQIVTAINEVHNDYEEKKQWYFYINGSDPGHLTLNTAVPNDGDTIDWKYEHRD
ncbi:uncharacterized protein [Ptychodera flava]|uniref:uncharacterized protein n=1 Tax=Ptychodera flava TaxID=63121 RepID=UPI00396A9C9B